MINQIHTVLGASGATGRAVILELQNRDLTIRAVNRSEKTSEPESVRADLLDREQTLNAVSGSSYVYLCVGLPYRSDVWENQWPLLIQNVIEACIEAKSRLVYFDNIYLYGPTPLSVPFNENHSQQPTTRKGIARKKTTDLLLNAIAENKLKAVIGRSADFYGPSAVNSPFYISFLENMLKNKKPQSIYRPDIKHTYANVSDNGRALVALALEPAAYGQVWHLPVGKSITIAEVADIFNEELGTNYQVSFLPPFVRKILSLFIPALKEVDEMLYQFNNAYEMSFDKFQKQFPEFKVTPYDEGIKEMVHSFRTNTNGKSNL